MLLAAIALALAIVLVVMVFARSRGRRDVSSPNEQPLRSPVPQADAAPRDLSPKDVAPKLVSSSVPAPTPPMKRGGGLRVPTGEREAPIARAQDGRDPRAPDDVSLRRRSTPPRNTLD
jgi:hypothetical protein